MMRKHGDFILEKNLSWINNATLISNTYTKTKACTKAGFCKQNFLQLNAVNSRANNIKELEQNPILEQIEPEDYEDKSMAEEILEEVDAPVEDMYTDESSYYLDQEKMEMPLLIRNHL